MTTSTAEDVQTEPTITETVIGTETMKKSLTTTNQHYNLLPRDPQTFFVDVDAPNGAFLKKVTVYFSTKDDEGLPVDADSSSP